MKIFIHLLTAAAVLGGTSLADSRIPGTRVSYKVQKEGLGGTNASMIFVDAAEDPSGKTYVSFVCDLGAPYFRLDTKYALVNSRGEPAGIIYRADQGNFHSALGTVRENRQTGKLTVMEITDSDSDELLRLFLSARSKVVVRLMTLSASSVTYTFPVKGFSQAYRAVKGCD